MPGPEPETEKTEIPIKTWAALVPHHRYYINRAFIRFLPDLRYSFQTPHYNIVRFKLVVIHIQYKLKTKYPSICTR
jgi:hypothetical protein